MRELDLLFGYTFPLDTIIDVRVHRARASGITALALGDQPTTLNLILSDGTRLEAHSRGRDPQQIAIESLTRALAQSRAAAAIEAIAEGHTFAFGEIALRPDGILYGGKVTRWERVAGYAIRQGGLIWDDEMGNLAGEVRLANIPFSDALCIALARRLPGKDYARMAPGEGPHGGVFAVTARTRTPGTPKYGKPLAAGIGMAFVLAVLAIFVMRSVSEMGDSWAPPRPVTITAATVAATSPPASAPPVIILASAPLPSASESAPKPVAKPATKRKLH
jgi:hypothetical protein